MRVNILLLIISVASVKAQSGTGSGSDQYGLYSNFNPSMAILIVVLVCSAFVIGIFSIFIRSCYDNSPHYHPSSSSAAASRYLQASGYNQPRSPRGLEKSVIESFPVLGYLEVKEVKMGSDPLECAVCLSEFQDGDSLRMLPKCSHVFHPDCIDTWLSSHVTCPVCRSNLEEVNSTFPETTSVPSSQDEIVVISVHELERPVRVTGVSIGGAKNLTHTTELNLSPPMGGRFPRSHSTGHSLVKEGVDRYTLRLPEEFRREVISRAKLQRAASFNNLPRAWSSRKGYKGNFIGGGGGGGEGSSRGGRWVFSRTPPFISREEGSVKSSSRVVNVNDNGGGGDSVNGRRLLGSVKLPLNCINVKVETMIGEPSTALALPRPLV